MQIFKDKKAIIAVAAVLVLVVAAGVTLAMNLGGKDIDIAEQLSLGQKYLLEMDYEKAILAFNKVIKVDPRNVKAYLGLADAYVGLGDTDKAIETLEKGLELTGDESIRAKLEGLKRAQENGNELVDWSIDDWVIGGINVFNARPEDIVEVLGGELRYYEDWLDYGQVTDWDGDNNSHGMYLHNLDQFYQLNLYTPGVAGIGGITIGKTSIDEVLEMFPLPDKPVYFNEDGHGYASVSNETGEYIWIYYPPGEYNDNPEGYPGQLLFQATVNSRLCNYSINFDSGRVSLVWFEEVDL